MSIGLQFWLGNQSGLNWAVDESRGGGIWSDFPKGCTDLQNVAVFHKSLFSKDEVGSNEEAWFKFRQANEA